MRKHSLYQLTLCALFAALISVLSPIAVPIGPIPISLGLFGVLLTALILPPLQTTAVVTTFLLLGLLGLPIFSAGCNGVAALVGPTGGYLWSYLLIAPTVSWLGKDGKAEKLFPLRAFVSCLCGILLCYACGTLQYCLLMHTKPLSALLVCVLPFLPFDLIKALAASYLAKRLRKQAEAYGRHRR